MTIKELVGALEEFDGSLNVIVDDGVGRWGVTQVTYQQSGDATQSWVELS